MVIRIRVLAALALAATGASAATPPAAFVEFELSHARAHVREQVVATVRLYTSEHVLTTALDDPAGDDLVVRPLERIAQARVVRDGTSYDLLTRRYALFPQAAGRITVRAPVLRGGENRSHGPALPFGGSLPTLSLREFAATAPARQLEVMPAAVKGRAWLPATAVRLIEEIEGEQDASVGRPLARTVLLEVDGQLHVQVPWPEAPAPETFRVYADPPDGRTEEFAGGLRARWQQRWALVPQRAGSLQLPELRVQWWDVTADAMREARVPARSVTVAPALVSTSAGVAAPSPEAAVEARVWRVTAIASVVAWGLTVAGLWRRRGPSPAPAPAAGRSASHAARELRAALRAGEPLALRSALLLWGRERCGCSAMTLRDLGAASGSPRFVRELERLDAALYGRGGPWDARALRAALRAPPAARQGGRAGLAPLYPLGGDESTVARPPPRPVRAVIAVALCATAIALLGSSLAKRPAPMEEADFGRLVASQEPEVLRFLRAFEQASDAMHPDDAAMLQAGLVREFDGRLAELSAQIESVTPPRSRATFAQAWLDALRALRQAHDTLAAARAEDFLPAFLRSRALFADGVASLYSLRDALPELGDYWRMPGTAPAATGRIVRHASGEAHGGYALYVPAVAETSDRPLVVVLHGSHGSSLSALLGWLRPAHSEGWLVLAPKSRDASWSLEQPELDLESIDAMLREVRARYRVDPRRIYLSGLSDGASFSWLLAGQEPRRFAALAAIAGVLPPGIDPARLAGRPALIVHGARDFIFPVAAATSAFERLQTAGAKDVRLEVLPDWGHATPHAINEQVVLPWLRRHSNNQH